MLFVKKNQLITGISIQLGYCSQSRKNEKFSQPLERFDSKNSINFKSDLKGAAAAKSNLIYR